MNHCAIRSSTEPSYGAASQQQGYGANNTQQQQRENADGTTASGTTDDEKLSAVYTLVEDLRVLEKRETALLELSKQRESLQVLLLKKNVS